MNNIDRHALTRFLNELLDAEGFPDYGPNGLQIEGVTSIRRIAFAVSATLDSIEQTIAADAQALIVHHGLFWKFHGARPLTGAFGRRVLGLAAHGINLYGYHLPLDAHPEIGNAAALGRRIGMVGFRPFGDFEGRPTGVCGDLPARPAAKELQRLLQGVLNREVWLATPDPEASVGSLGIITGGANRDWRRAVSAGLDGYLTGEMSEHDWHEAREAGLHMFAGGHHATERYGIQELMAQVQAEFAVDCFYIDSVNPA